MVGSEQPTEVDSLHQGRLDAHDDARAIIRLFQCSCCSRPLHEPMTLPCGHSLCRRCLPLLHKRDNISYPVNPGRAEGFLCPFSSCGLEHSLADCSTNVTLNKLLELVRDDFERHQAKTGIATLLLQEKLPQDWARKNPIDTALGPRVLHGGRLAATYLLADTGELDYHSDLLYNSPRENDDGVRALDVAVLQQLKEDTRAEMECQVCYSLMLDPLTTPCGHTYCRRCVARVLDHSNLCPACRRPIPLPPGVQTEPSNKLMSQLIGGLCPDLLQVRIATAEQDDRGDSNLDVPLFPCGLAYPEMPTFLYIFEPRYRLMVRRVMQTDDRQFGMLMYNRRGTPQGVLGQTHFVQYGTLLRVQNVQIFPDGRSVVETKGTSRFKVLETAMRDGYLVGRIQKVADVSLAEEEAAESRATRVPEPSPNDALGRLNHMPTQHLLQFGLDFISRAQASSEPWLADRFLSAYGPPPSDPAIFPYWFASVLPISEDEKYQLLPTTSVRERLKIIARWIQRLEAARW